MRHATVEAGRASAFCAGFLHIHGSQLPRPQLKSVLLTTDHVPAAIVQAVEAAWNCTVYNHYGMT
ncbi:MAG TPA: hypothetical protein PKY73_14880, partial [Hyphomonas sp.]|nr:hypothetical protein [Hyphomonas sp.]